MATLAKSSITLNSISDAYAVSLQPSNISINTDVNGLNPDLTNAYTIISLYCGDTQVPIIGCDVVASSTSSEDDSLLEQYDAMSYKLTLTSITQDSTGWREIAVTTNNNQILKARFSYTTIREVNQIAWVLEWNKEYTEITGDHVATPNAFIGGSGSEEGTLTGVYIGAGMPNHTAGIYAIKDCDATGFTQGNIEDNAIFILNENGGLIGGWEIQTTGIFTSNDNGQVEIKSDGTIRYTNNEDTNTPYWALNNDGSGSLAKGNIVWDVDGNAQFNGHIVTTSGKIGGWVIGSNSLYNSHILMDSDASLIGIKAMTMLVNDTAQTASSFIANAQKYGGIYMYYTSTSSYGLRGYTSKLETTDLAGIVQWVGSLVFSLGDTNQIAGWSFDEDSLYLGVKCNTAGSYVSETDSDGNVNPNSITIGSNGIRGFNWFLDADGSCSFLKGAVAFTLDGGVISGWDIYSNYFGTSHIALVSSDETAGIYISTKDLGDDASQHLNIIQKSGGLYAYHDGSYAELGAYNSTGACTFRLSSNFLKTNIIAGWKFTDTAIFSVGLGYNTDTGFADVENNIIISTAGLRGYTWKLETDGSGAVAKGNIAWDSTGAGQLANGGIAWDADGNITLGEDVTVLWRDTETQNNAYVAQRMAFAQILYRDTEFANGFNDIVNYLDEAYIYVDYADITDYLANCGFTMRGYGVISKIQVVYSDYTTAVLWSGSVELSTTENYQFISADDFAALNLDSDVRFIISVFYNSPIVQLVTEDTEISPAVYLTGFASSDAADTTNIGTYSAAFTKSIVTGGADIPNSTGNVMQIISYRWHSKEDLRIGGFAFQTPTRANGEYIVRLIAKFSANYQINAYHNEFGSGGTSTWIGSQLGTGNWQEYILLIKCGSSGTFSTINYFALTAAVGTKTPDDPTDLSISVRAGTKFKLVPNVTWEIAYATVYDATASDKVTTVIDKNGIYTGTLRADQIVSGTISSKFIDTEGLIAKEVLVGDSAGKHVHIDPEDMSMKIYDENADLCSVFEGKRYDTLKEVFGEVESGTIALSNTTSETISYTGAVGATLSDSQSGTVTLGTVTTVNPTEIKIAVGYIYLHAYSGAYTQTNTQIATNSNGAATIPLGTVQKIHEASASITIKVTTYEDETMTTQVGSTKVISSNLITASASASSEHTTEEQEKYINIGGCSAKTVSGGYHVIELSYNAAASTNTDKAELSWGYSSALQATPLSGATYNTDIYKSYFFANGFILGTRIDNYVMAKRTDNGMEFTMENSSYGFKFSSNGIQYKSPSKTSWTNLIS